MEFSQSDLASESLRRRVWLCVCVISFFSPSQSLGGEALFNICVWGGYLCVRMVCVCLSVCFCVCDHKDKTPCAFLLLFLQQVHFFIHDLTVMSVLRKGHTQTHTHTHTHYTWLHTV
jgi:hypothetical protein